MRRNGRMFVSCLADESDNMSSFPSWFPTHSVNGSSRSPSRNNLKEVWVPTFSSTTYKTMTFIWAAHSHGSTHADAQCPEYYLSSSLPLPPTKANQNNSECDGITGYPDATLVFKKLVNKSVTH